MINTELKTTLSTSFFRRFCPDPTVMYDLGDLYAELNAKFFNGQLPVLAETVRTVNGVERKTYPSLKWDGRLGRRTLGVYTPASKRGNGKIRLARRIAEDPAKTRSVLLHEMLHKFLDLHSLDDGIAGHGPNFISEAKAINGHCTEWGVNYRIHFYDEEITREDPVFYSDVLKMEIDCRKDLDFARKVQSVIRAAFDTNYEYHQ